MRHEPLLDRAGRLARRGVTLVAIATLVTVVAIGDPRDPDARVAYADGGPTRARASPWLERRPVRAPAAPAIDDAAKLDLNTATGPELDRLPGIGPAKALRILEFRARHGGFKRLIDLRRVKGFGKKTVDRLAPYLTVRRPPPTG
jgi:competence protein ComEA